MKLKLRNMMYLIIALASTAILGLQFYMAQSRTEEQPYEVLKKDNDFEIRYYPPAVLATVSKKGPYRSMMNAGFRDLAGYIFGGNTEGEKIAMTAPVISVHDAEKEEAEISFVMPRQYQLTDLPAPKAGHIHFSETEAVYTASLTFGGFASEADMARKAELLFKKIAEAGLRPIGPVEYLYYNPPFQLFGRRNEVLVRIEK